MVALVAGAGIARSISAAGAFHRTCRELLERRCTLADRAHITWNVVDDPVNESERSISIVHNDSEGLCALRRRREPKRGRQIFVSTSEPRRHLLAADEA